MLNKELLIGGAEELWTMQFYPIGDIDVQITLALQDGSIVWEGSPGHTIMTLHVPQQSVLRLTWGDGVGVAEITLHNGILVEHVDKREIACYIQRDNTYLEVRFLP